MKTITREWLSRAAEDLAAAQALLLRADLTNVVAFHAQQTVEKTLKAVIEEYDLGMIRTHSLTRLYELVRPHHPVNVIKLRIWFSQTRPFYSKTRPFYRIN